MKDTPWPTFISSETSTSIRRCAVVEQSFALLSEEYSVSISLREGTDDWSVQVVGPATVVAGGIPVNDQKPEAITRYVRQMIRGLPRG